MKSIEQLSKEIDRIDTHINDLNNIITKLTGEVGNCKLNVYQKVNEVEDTIHTIEQAIIKQADKRDEYNMALTSKLDALTAKLGKLADKFHKHDADEATKYDEISSWYSMLTEEIKGLSGLILNLNQKTEDNSNFIAKLKKYWIRISFITTGAVSTVIAIWWLINYMQKNGMLILFPVS